MPDAEVKMSTAVQPRHIDSEDAYEQLLPEGAEKVEPAPTEVKVRSNLFQRRRAAQRASVDNPGKLAPGVLPYAELQRADSLMDGKTEAEAAPEQLLCSNVFERKRGGRQGGERCQNPATSSGFCRTCRNSSKFRPAPEKPEERPWQFGLLEGAIVEAEPDKSGDFTWPVKSSGEKPNFTHYWAVESGNASAVEALIAAALRGKISDKTLGTLFIAFLGKIVVRCGKTIWWFRTETLMWTDLDPVILLVKLSEDIAAAAEIMSSRLPLPPKAQRGQARPVDVHEAQRFALDECVSILSSTTKSKAVFARFLAKAPAVDDFESRKNMDMRYLPCAGGQVFDYATGEVLNRNFNHHFDYEAPVNPNLATRESCEQVREYFRHLLWRDGQPATDQMISAFTTILGIFISGDIEDQSILFLKGDSSNGKSQLISILEQTLGEAYSPVSDAVFRSVDGQGASPALAAVMGGKRLLAMSELNKSIRLSSEMIKKITSTEKISYREIYEKTRSGRITGHFIIATNTPVQFDLIDEAIRRRVFCLEFPVRFVELNGEEWTDEHRASNVLPRRPEVIRTMHNPECKAALLHLLSENWRHWKSSALSTLPEFPGLENATSDFIGECAAARSNVSDFVSERLVVTSGAKLSTLEVLESYKAWSSNPRATASWLKERLSELGIVAFKTLGKMFYKNVAFSTPQFTGVL